MTECVRTVLTDPDAVVPDTETTGRDRESLIVELAVQKVSGDVLVDTLLNPGEPIPADATVLMYQAPCRDDAAEAGRRLVIKRTPVPGSGRARSCRAVATKWRGRLSYRWSKVTLFVTAGGVAARPACQLGGSGSRCGGDGQMPPAGGQLSGPGLESYLVRSVRLRKALQA